MAMSTTIALTLLLLAMPVTGLQVNSFLMAEKQLINSMSRVASSLRKHLLETESMVPLGPSQFADAAREILKREAGRLPVGRHADLMHNYASWAPDAVLIMTPNDEQADASNTMTMPTRHAISEETVIHSDGKNLIKETTRCSNGNCETIGQVVGSKPGNSIAQRGLHSALHKVGSLDVLHHDMKGLSTSMNQLGGLLGRGMAKKILGKILNRALEQSDLGAEVPERVPAVHHKHDHRDLKSAQSMGSALDDALMKQSIGKALHGLSNTGKHSDAGSSDEKEYWRKKVPEIMKEAIASEEDSGIKDKIKKASGIKSPGSKSQQEKEFDAGWNLGRQLAEKILGSLSGPSRNDADHEDSHPQLDDGNTGLSKSQARTSDGHLDFSGSQIKSKHHKNHHKMDIFQDSAAQLGRELGKDLANAVIGSMINKDGKEDVENADSSEAHGEAFKKLDKALKSVENTYEDQDQDSVGNSNDSQKSEQSQDQQLSAPATSGSWMSKAKSSQNTASSVTSVKDGKRITKEKICENGHCKTVVTTEDLDSAADSNTPESDAMKSKLANTLKQVFAPLEALRP